MKLIPLLLTGCLFTSTAFAKNWSRQEILDYVNLSPLYVDQHQKEGWVGLFDSESSFVQDPVGGYTFKKERIGQFWDAFIAKNNIRFEIKHDIISNLTVVRDAVVDAYLPEADAHVYTPAHLRYTLFEKDGQLRVKSLQAYWNMPKISKETFARGAVGRKIMSVQLKNIMDGLGYGVGLSHFLSASMLGVNQRGQKTVHQLIAALNGHKSKAFLKKFHSGGKIIFNTEQKEIPAASFVSQGYEITDIDKMISSGDSVAFNCKLKDASGQSKTALAVANFKLLRLQNLEFFVENP